MAKLLVVDDEKGIRDVIREYSEFNGHEVTEAEDGMTAVGFCKLNEYDLIIMDIMMPKLDGYSACKEIRKISRHLTNITDRAGNFYKTIGKTYVESGITLDING